METVTIHVVIGAKKHTSATSVCDTQAHTQSQLKQKQIFNRQVASRNSTHEYFRYNNFVFDIMYNKWQKFHKNN